MSQFAGPSPTAMMSPRRPSHRLMAIRARPELVLSPVLLVVVLFCWEYGVKWLNIPKYILPAPSQVLAALWYGLDASIFSRGGYWLHTGVTFAEVLLGFFIGSSVGLILGTVISQIRLLEATLRIYIVALQSLPKIALAPIIVLWFGYGLTSKVVIICLLTFFPLLVTSMAGFRAVDRERLELMRALGAGNWQSFWKVRLPSALPFIFAGLEMAAVFSVVGAVVGEFVGAQRGLGTLILSMDSEMNTAGTFSVFIILCLIGSLMHFVLKMIQKRFLFWSGTSMDAIGS
jgi:NitT/TauT family transport system permease protein